MDEEPSDNEPLLVPDDHGAWDDVEIAANELPAVTVQQLIKQDPDHVVRLIAKKGVVKLGEFKVQVRPYCRSALTDGHLPTPLLFNPPEHTLHGAVFS